MRSRLKNERYVEKLISRMYKKNIPLIFKLPYIPVDTIGSGVGRLFIYHAFHNYKKSYPVLYALEGGVRTIHQLLSREVITVHVVLAFTDCCYSSTLRHCCPGHLVIKRTKTEMIYDCFVYTIDRTDVPVVLTKNQLQAIKKHFRAKIRYID